MSKQNIPSRKKYALWISHKEVCHYCKEPLRYQDVWVDHILPERLLNNPDKLVQIIQEYTLDVDFKINDYCNWLPSHWQCNVRKGGTIFGRGAARYYIEIARKKIPIARKEEETLIRNLKNDKLVGSWEVALSEGLLSKESLYAILMQDDRIHGEEEPTVITFGLNYYKLWENSSRPEWLDEYEPGNYPIVCDFLERDLVRQLQFLLSCDFCYSEPSLRNGETLSVRLLFIQLDKKEIYRFRSEWWELLEFKNFSSVYGMEFREQYT